MKGIDSFHPEVITQYGQSENGAPYSNTYSYGGASFRTVAAMHFMAALISSGAMEHKGPNEIRKEAFELADSFVLESQNK